MTGLSYYRINRGFSVITRSGYFDELHGAWQYQRGNLYIPTLQEAFVAMSEKNDYGIVHHQWDVDKDEHVYGIYTYNQIADAFYHAPTKLLTHVDPKFIVSDVDAMFMVLALTQES